MPATIVIVYDDPDFAVPTLTSLRAAGYDVVAFQDSMSGIDALEHPKRIELLITLVRFPRRDAKWRGFGTHGSAQAPWHKGCFHIISEVRQHTEGLGEFLP
jgi:hypothetical protein